MSKTPHKCHGPWRIMDCTGTTNRCQGHNMCDMHVRDTVVVTAHHRHVRDTIGMLGTPKKSDTPQMCRRHHRSVIDAPDMAGTSQKCQRCTWHGRDTTDSLKTPQRPMCFGQQRSVKNTTHLSGQQQKGEGNNRRVRDTKEVRGTHIDTTEVSSV